MDILTLVKADLRKKKGTLISILLLTIIVTMAFGSIISAKDRLKDSFENALTLYNAPDVLSFSKRELLTDEYRDSLVNHELIGDVVYHDGIVANRLLSSDGDSNGNITFMAELFDGIKLYNEDLTELVDSPVPPLEPGEAYLPVALHYLIGVDVGDVVTMEFFEGYEKNLVVRGFIQEPMVGSYTIGYKTIIANGDDIEQIREDLEAINTNNNYYFDISLVFVYMADGIDMSGSKFVRQLNMDIGFSNNAIGVMSKDQASHYSTLLMEILLSVMIVFVCFLYVIELVVIGHNISTEIDAEYVKLGVLKAIGFDEGRLRKIFLIEYIAPTIIGVVIGLFLASPVEAIICSFGSRFSGVATIKPSFNPKVVLLITLTLVVTCLFVMVCTRKICKISPVKAISGGRADVYFDSRIKTPIRKRGLYPTLALRQVTSNLKKYIGIAGILAGISFFMISANLIANMFNEDSMTLVALGEIEPDIIVEVPSPEVEDEIDWDEIDAIVASHVEVEHQFSSSSYYMLLEGENIYCRRYDNIETIEQSLLDGRLPIYDNEIMITEFVADALDLEIGDEVSVVENIYEKQFVITGTYQTMNDTGMCFAMGENAYLRLYSTGNEEEDATHRVRRFQRIYTFDSISKNDSEFDQEADAIIEDIKEYNPNLDAYKYNAEDNEMMNLFSFVVDLLRVMIIILSLVFIAISIHMVCTRAVIQEKTELGIYKAIGFSSSGLRLQFALRFGFIALLGVAIGTVLSILFSTDFIGAILKALGVSRLVLDFTVGAIALPLAIVIVACIIFAYISLRKVNKLETRSLVVE